MNNSTNHINEEPVSLFDPTFKYTIATCFILIAVVAAVGNVLVCFAILANRHLRSYPTNLFLLSLAVTDLLTVSLAMPFDIEFVFLQGAWRHGKIMCATFMTFYLNSGPNPILTLLVISVDRYKNLKDPFRRFRNKESMTQKRALIVISIIWICSVMWALLPVVMGWRVKGLEPMHQGFCTFPATKLYRSMYIVFILVLMVITCVFHIRIYLIARKHHRSVPGFNTEDPPRHPSKDATKEQRNLKSLKTTSMFVAAFFFCWQPYSYLRIVFNLYGSKHWNPYPWKVYVALLMLYYLNSALNPFLFAFRNNSFKATYVKLFNSLKPSADPRSNSSIRVSRNISSEIPAMDIDAVRFQAITHIRETPARIPNRNTTVLPANQP